MADVKFYKQNGTSGASEGSIVFDTSDKTIKLVEGSGVIPYKGVIESSVLESDNAVSAKAVYNYAAPQATVVSGLYSAMFTDDRKFYIAEDCDALYAADKRFTISGTDNEGNTYQKTIYASLFDGTLESIVSFRSGTNTILIDCGDNFAWTYGEGKLLVCVYHTYAPESVSARVWSNGSSAWFDVTMEHKGGPNNQWFEGTTPTVISVSKIEITINVAEGADCRINNLLYILQRPDYHSASVRKYQPETLYHNLTVPSLTVGGTNFTGNASELKDFTTKVYDATLTRIANTFLAAPDDSNGPATFRKITSNDLPSSTWITQNKTTIFAEHQSYLDWDGATEYISERDALLNVLKTLCKRHPNVVSGTFIGRYSPNSAGIYNVFIYDTSKVNNETGLPEHSMGWASKYGAKTYYFGTATYSFLFAKSVTDNELSNAAVKTADQLTWADWS